MPWIISVCAFYMSSFSLLVWKTSLWMTSPQMMTLWRGNHSLKVDLTSPLPVWPSVKRKQTICVNCFTVFAVPARVNTQPSQRRLPTQQSSSVFLSDEEDDDMIVVKSTWKTRHLKQPSKTKAENAALCDEAESSAAELTVSPLSLPGQQTVTSLTTPKHTLSVTSTMDDSPSSDEEFTSLLERLKKKKCPSTTFSPHNTQGSCFHWTFTV